MANDATSWVDRCFARLGLSMRGKLILLFIVIKVIPLLLTLLVAWSQARILVDILRRSIVEISNQSNSALANVGSIAINDSLATLNSLVIDEMERASTDMAKRIASFLYGIDNDVRFLVSLPASEETFREFAKQKMRPIIKPRDWILAPDKKSWIPRESLPEADAVASTNPENNTNLRYRPSDRWQSERRPLFLEITFVDLDGNEKIKATTSPLMDPALKNIADCRNTFVKAETYFAEAQKLGEGELYVSDVIGAYVRSRVIGMYSPENCAARGVEFQPENDAYAGEENPNGKRFRGLVRWVAPVFQNGEKIGYLTAALDHDHILEFINHITPMRQRYAEIPSAFEGNYAFIWDYQCRSIAHPRHHSIVGYDPETGEPAVPWLEESIYRAWQNSGQSYADFIKNVPVFDKQSRAKKPAKELTAVGLVGLDGRYLNNAPQCTGWMDLTADGGSGSFLILWSGIWKPNAVAAIPYYTGNYGKSRRGFGMLALGAGFEDFQRPAYETKAMLDKIISLTNHGLKNIAADTFEKIDASLWETTISLFIFASIMIVIVIAIAIWLVALIINRIATINDGITRYRSGERQFRFDEKYRDEISLVTLTFNDMADSLATSDREPLVIVNMAQQILYANDLWLQETGLRLSEVCGKPYKDYSFYPSDHWYNPIGALEENHETEIMYLATTDSYYRGKASYLKDISGKKIGYVIISQNLTEVLRQQRKLEETIAETNIANEHKGQFLARMSHEIRTPLNAIIGIIGIIKKHLAGSAVPDDAMMSNVRQIETSSYHLLGLLNDILDISKIESGKIELSMTQTDLLELIQNVATIIKVRADEQKINFITRFELPSGARFFMCDALRLRQVLINLLNNAVKFTPEGGAVTFVVEEKERLAGKTLLHFVVKDTGIGIAEAEIKNLFKPFNQANKSIAQKFGGTGLGLAISRTLVQMFGGDIKVRSIEKAGSRFSFSIWLTNCADVIETVIDIAELAGKLQGKRALLVDDVSINRIIAISIFDGTELEIDEADDGAEAVEKFRQSSPFAYDLIFMDVQMPKMNGYEAAQAIRALDRPDAKSVPILALTANAFKDDIEKAVASGMTSHLAKPLDAEKVLSLTAKLLRLKLDKTPATAENIDENRDAAAANLPDDTAAIAAADTVIANAVNAEPNA